MRSTVIPLGALSTIIDTLLAPFSWLFYSVLLQKFILFALVCVIVYDYTGSGTGLGLFISKSIVEAHDGKIWAGKIWADIMQESAAVIIITVIVIIAAIAVLFTSAEKHIKKRVTDIDQEKH